MTDTTTSNTGAPAAPVAPAAPAAPAVTQQPGTPAATGTQEATVGQQGQNPGQGTPAPAGSLLDLETPAAVSQPATPAKVEGTGDSATGFERTGDLGFDIALGFAEKLGLTPEDPEVKAAFEGGDFALLEAKLAAMGDKAAGYKEHLGLAKGYFDRQVQAEAAKITECEDTIISTVGSVEDWRAIQEWAKANADPDEREFYTKMLTGGARSARMAAAELQRLYQNAKGTVVEPQKSVLNGAPPTQSNAGSGPLTSAQYTQAVQELAQRVGSFNVDNHPEYHQLRARLAASMR